MTREVPNVRTWSKTVPDYLFVLGDLDVYVLKQHDEVLQAMGRTQARTRGDLPDVPIVLANLLAPGVAIAGWTGDPRRGLDGAGRAADVLAAWCLAIASAGVVLAGWRWVRSRRHWNGLETAGVATTLVAALFSLASMRDSSGPDALGLTTLLPVLSAAVLSACVGGAMAVASQGKRVPFRRYFRITGPADPERIERLVDALEPRRREKLLDERRRAVRRLLDRGLIDGRRGDDVQSLPLGLSPTVDGGA